MPESYGSFKNRTEKPKGPTPPSSVGPDPGAAAGQEHLKAKEKFGGAFTKPKGAPSDEGFPQPDKSKGEDMMSPAYQERLRKYRESQRAGKKDAVTGILAERQAEAKGAY